jgi:septin family protein
MTIQLKKFDIKSLFEDEDKIPNIMIIGRRSTGKTVLINDILDNYQYTNGTVISSNINNIHIYKKNTESPDIHIYKHMNTNS